MSAIYILLESTFSGLRFRRWQYGSICIRLAVIASETREISRNSKRIWPYSTSRSSKVIDLGVNGKPICDFLLVTNNATVFEIFTFTDRKLLILPIPPLFDASARGEPLRISEWILHLKNKRDEATVWWKFHNPNLNRLTDRRTDRQTDGRTRAIAYSALSMLSRAKT